MKSGLMKCGLIIFILLAGITGIHSSVVGQNARERDSVLAVISGMADDTAKVEKLISLAEEYTWTDISLAEQLAQEALDLSRKMNYTRGLAYANYRLGQIFMDSDYEVTEGLILESLELAGELNDSLLLGKIYNIIGNMKDKIGEYQEAKEYYDKALALFLEHEGDSLAASVYNNLGIIYEELEQYDLSTEYYSQAAEINKRTGNFLWLAINYLNIGYGGIISGDLERGLLNINKSLEIALEKDYRRILPYIYNNFSHYYQITGDYSSTIKYARLAETHAIENNNLMQLQSALEYLKQAYLSKNDYESAYFYSEKVGEVSDSINRYTKLKEIDLLQMRYAYEKEKKQQELESELLRAEIRRKELTLGMIIAGAGLLILIFILLYLIQHNRIRRKSLEQKTTLLEKENLMQQLEFKNKELTTNVMYLLKKNEFINTISNKLKSAEFKDSTIGGEVISKIISELDRSISEDNWSDFEVRFQEVHVDFYNKLSKQFPELTPNELRLCAFLKLNMTTKEIAGITYQSADSLKTARYRLRKKMGMSRDENLVAYLTKI